MKGILLALRALVVGILTNEPALVIGTGVSIIVAVLALIGLTLPVTIITTVVTVLVGAVVTRLQVTPTAKVILQKPPDPK